MDKTQLKRHDLVYPSSIGRARLKQVFLNELTGEKAFLAADIFRADSVIPGIVRRAEVLSADVIPLGFVHPQLCEGRRLRLTAELEVGEAVKRTEIFLWLLEEKTWHTSTILATDQKDV